MKYGLLKYSRSRNFGDQVQSLAARQYLPQVDTYLDRDSLHEFEANEPTCLILNGWFMARPENWPPTALIKPLLVSFHITHEHNAHEKLFTEKIKAFYKNNEPVGCRDYFTLNLMKSHGIEAYYSGCLTLTLKREHFTTENAGPPKVYLVDVLYKVGNSKIKFFNNWQRKWLIRKLVPPEILAKAEFITQVVPKRTSEEDKFKIAEEALKKYANASLVITSRIHCALPCTAFGTKVLFIDGALEESADTTRLKGIGEYFNLYKVNYLIQSYRGFFREVFAKFAFTNPLNIDWQNPPANPGNHLEVAEQLRATASKFIKSTD